jgi:transcription antitermination factor NusG
MLMTARKDEYLAYIVAKAERDGPFHAEIVPSEVPQWYALQTAPGHEHVAAAHLAGRRFGVFVPAYQEPRQGDCRANKTEPIRRILFPRHIFVFVWDVLKHWRRIHACPGVVRVLTIDERPVVVPDAAINQMHMIELKGLAIFEKPKRRRGRRHWVTQEDNSVVTISSYSALDGVERLDDAGRVGILHKALGLI